MEDMSSLAEAILEQIADAVIYADDTGTIMRWNHAAAALFGYSAAEALGQNLDLIIPEHLRVAPEPPTPSLVSPKPGTKKARWMLQRRESNLDQVAVTGCTG